MGQKKDAWRASRRRARRHLRTSYDAAGSQLIRHDTTGATLYLGAGTEIRLDKASNVARATRYYGYGDGVVAMRTTQGLTWLTNDRQGTGTAAINATSQQAIIRKLTPFGTPRGA